MSRIEENFAEKDSEKIRQEVEERFFRLNKAFIWTPMNTEKIKNLILEINRKMNSLYDKVQILKQDFDSGAEDNCLVQRLADGDAERVDNLVCKYGVGIFQHRVANRGVRADLVLIDFYLSDSQMQLIEACAHFRPDGLRNRA